jgi:hypothetical protein
MTALRKKENLTAACLGKRVEPSRERIHRSTTETRRHGEKPAILTEDQR